MKPITRIELYLAKLKGENTTIPEPITRIEYYLAYLCGENVVLPEPITRLEVYLAYLCGIEIDLPEPITRIEKYLYAIAGMGDKPEKWITRVEYYLDGIELTPQGEAVTITGVSPLLLAAALEKEITALIQSGKVEQDDTPTPSAPVPIVCNNGTLRMVDDELPAEYKRVLGFTCNNNALWQITGFKLKGSDTVRISFSIDGACNVFGCYQGADATDNYDLYVSTSANAKYFRYGNGTYLSYWSSANLGQRFDVVYTPNGSQGMPQDSTWAPMTFTAANDLLIGATTLTGSSAKMKGSFYGNFVVDGRLKLIPCERVSDGVLGYYDTYGETFYEPYTGFDGAVSLGYDGSHYSLAVVGTEEVITLGKNFYDGENVDPNHYYNASGVYVSSQTAQLSNSVPVKSGDIVRCTTTTINGAGSTINVRYNQLDKNGEWVSQSVLVQDKGTTITTTITIGQDGFFCFSANASGQTYVLFENTIITVNEQTASAVNLFAVGDYVDEVEIISGAVTRKVGVKVLDGTEDWKSSTTPNVFYVAIDGMKYCNPVEKGYSSHFVGSNASNTNMPNGSCKNSYTASGDGVVSFKYTSASALAEWTAWLAAQYAAGTPVIVIYPLAEPTTESTTPQSLSTTQGDNVVSVTANVSDIPLEITYTKQN